MTYEREHPGTFELDERGQYFKVHEAVVAASGEVVLKPAETAAAGFFTSYQNPQGKTVSFYGDNHPYYAGSVVKAMASAKDGYPHVAALFPELRALDRASQPARDDERRALFAKLDRRARRDGARGEPPHADHRRGRRPRADGRAKVPPRPVLSASKLRVARARRRRHAPRHGGPRAHRRVGRPRARPHGHHRPRDGRELAPLRRARARRARGPHGTHRRAHRNRRQGDGPPLRRRPRQRGPLLDRARFPRDGQQGPLLRRVQGGRAISSSATRSSATPIRSSGRTDGGAPIEPAPLARRPLPRQHRRGHGRLRQGRAGEAGRQALRR